MKTKTITLDTETGGLNPYTDGIAQLCIIDENEFVLFNDFMKPQKNKFYRASAFEVNKLNFETLERIGLTKTEFTEKLQYIINELSKDIDYLTLKGFNISFDLGFLKDLKLQLPICLIEDVMDKSAELKKQRIIKSKSLLDTYKYFYPHDIEITEKAHGAFYDCVMTNRVDKKFKEIEEKEKLAQNQTLY